MPSRTTSAPSPGATLFTKLPASFTGISFANRVTDTQEANVFTYRNHYHGGGVGIGDLNGDSLPEIVLTSNEEGAKIYLNEGGFRFRDVTRASGALPNGVWTTGVAMADVNGDGRLDVYISHAGNTNGVQRANQLFINQGTGEDNVPTFRDEAESWGATAGSFSTQAAFLDFDRDGDLDLFLVNNAPSPVSGFGVRNTRHVRDPDGGARLYRNEGNRFVDVSAAAGIYGSEIGFGLGVSVGDVNRDGWPDIYVANDFFEHDYLYINGGNGTFSEQISAQMPYSSYFSMGMDIADVNNDGWLDIYTTDMLPEDPYRLRTLISFEGWNVYQARLRQGYHHQLMRNMLQLNNGNGTFTEVAHLAGVASTDWSWSAIVADFDLDGWKDIFVANGLAKDETSQDYVANLANQATADAVAREGKVDFLKLVGAMPSTKISNYAFRGHDGVSFTNEAKAWGLDTPAFSNGAAYGDLDGDGALDLVVNNVNDDAFVYRNNARTLHPTHEYLQVRLMGEGRNTLGIGARVVVHCGTDVMMQELQPTRGFQSSQDYALTFGAGTKGGIDSVVVTWSDGRMSTVRAVPPNAKLVVRQADAVSPPVAPVVEAAPLLVNVSDRAGPAFTHRENEFVDFDREKLIPKLVSTDGPTMAVADVNGDGLDDVYVGGAKEQAGELHVQRRDGTFERTSIATFAQDSTAEDVGATFFDANGDRHPDLYVVSGGSEFSEGATALQDRLYLNDGRGGFQKATDALPAEAFAGSRVTTTDYDGDGDIDVFVGGRVVPWHYGRPARSMLLRNDGRGRFTDVTIGLAPELAEVGMVTDAVWQDITGDSRMDLVVVGEWMPITVFQNAGTGRLAKAAIKGLERSHGWWNRIIAGDFTGDGRIDLIAGNLGLNSQLRATDGEPATMYVKDFDGNGVEEQVMATFAQGRQYPFVMRDDLIKAIPPLKARYLRYEDYARATIADVFPPPAMEGAAVLTAYTFATSLVRNDGNGAFTLVPLPREVQLSPVSGIVAGDVDGNATTDLLLTGNFDGVQPQVGRMAGSYGALLRGDGKGTFSFVPARASGFVVPGQGRDVQRVRTRMGDVWVVARNNDRVLTFRRRAGA